MKRLGHLCLAALVLVSMVGLPAHVASATVAKVGPPTRITALGDSITRGYDSQGSGCVILSDCPAFSWATGSNATVNSYFRRVQAINPSVVLSNPSRGNDAVTGAKVADLNGQATTAIAGNPDLVLILIGANDVCTSTEGAMTTVSDFRTRFQTAMNTLTTNLPDARIQVMSIPNIFNLWNVLHTNFLATATWGLAGICQSMLANPTSNAAADVQRRARVQQRNIDFNTVLQQSCALYVHCRWDNNAAYNLTFASSDVSTVDYFHPNTNGQAKAALTAWNATFNYSDLTAPATTISRDRPADGVNDWYRNNVTVSISATDGSGVSGSEDYQLQGAGTLPWSAYSAPFTISTEGITNVTARSVDTNGNINASQTAAIKIDKTPPTFTLTCPSQVPMNGAAAITISSANDSTSGFLTSPNSSTPIDTSTIGHFTHTAQVSDEAGNTTTHSCAWDVIDVTAPTISIASPLDGASIPQNASVAADYSCADETGGSGLATCAGTAPEGSNIDTAALGAHTFTVNATDNAGNPATKSVMYTVVDVTPPTIDINSPTDGQIIPQHGTVAADYTCADEPSGSGLASCVGSVANGDPIATATLGAHTFAVDAADNAGNPNHAEVSYTVVDVTPPTIMINAPLDGASIPQNASVAADYSCADESGGSGIASCVGPVAAGSAIDTAGLGEHTFTVQAIDNAGNPATKSVTYTVVDVTAPTITVTAPTPGQVFTLGQQVSAAYSCADEAGGSGLASCIGNVANGAALDTSSVGAKTLTVNATDNAGNVSTKNVAYTVAYRFGGVLQPVNADGSSVFKAGSTVPVKFQLFTTSGTPISTANVTLSYAKISNNVVGDDTEAVSTSNATTGNAFRYDSTAQQYIFNLSTKGWSQGTYRLTIHSLDDLQSYSVTISTR